MKIRTDFVTNSSSSGFVVISVTMRDGTEYEIEREYDTGFGGYFWASVSESMDDALPELKNGLELLELLRSNINNFEEFILFKDKQGITFKENVSAINDFNDVKSIIIAEQTRFDDGGSDSCRLEFTNKASVTRSKYEDNDPTANSYRCVGIKSKKLAELLLGMTDYIQEATGEKTILTDEDKYEMIIDEDIISLVAPYDMPEYHWRKQLDYEFASSAADVAGVLSPVLFFHSSTDRSNFWSFLEEAIVQADVLVQACFDGNFTLQRFSKQDFLRAQLLLNPRGQVIGCKEKIHGNPDLTIPTFFELQENAFKACKSTKHIIAEQYVRFSNGSFARCKSLETLTLGGGNDILPQKLCEACTSLREVVFPDDIYRIDERAFYGCENLEKINLPNSVLYIDPTAFDGCTKLPQETLHRIQQLSDKEAFEKTIKEAVEYIQTHGDAKYSLYTDRLFHSDSRIYSSLFRKKAEYERWYDIHAPYFDQPEVLPKGKVVYSVYAPKDVAINMSTYGWKQQKALTNSVEYLVVDTTVIPNFDRFLYKIDAIDRGDLQKAKNFGSNMLEKAIELKKSGHPIQIITRAHLEACIAANAFEEKVVGPTKAELRAIEAQKEREAKKAKKADAFEQVMLALQAHCSSTGKKFENLSEVNEFAQNLGVTLENYRRKIQQEHNMTQGEYYAHLGVLATTQTRFQDVMCVLTERYCNAGKKAKSVEELVAENPDLEVQLIRNYAQSFAGLSARELLIKEGIMYNDEELVAQKAPSVAAQKDPAQIPENIRKRMDTLFAKLGAAYPDKVIVRLHADHKKWAETVTELYRALGYASPSEFLAAYGYQQGAVEDKGGRPKKDPMEIINELNRRYPNGADFKSVGELKEANLDIASRLKSLENKSKEYFGMPFTQYLRSIGLIK